MTIVKLNTAFAIALNTKRVYTLPMIRVTLEGPRYVYYYRLGSRYKTRYLGWF